MPGQPIGIQQDLFDHHKSKMEKYQALFIGKKSLWALIKYELIIMFCSWLPGALGILLRSKLYPHLLGQTGRGVAFGMNVVLRHPHKIVIGDNVVIDDNCLLDAKGENNKGIHIHDGVFIGRNTILSCKNGDIEIGENSNIGFNCEIFSASRVTLGKNALFAAYCYLVGGEHKFDRVDVSVLEQDRQSNGITIGNNVWFGAGVKVLDGVSVGDDSIIGAAAVVKDNVPSWSIAVGIPAKVIKKRK